MIGNHQSLGYMLTQKTSCDCFGHQQIAAVPRSLHETHQLVSKHFKVKAVPQC